MWDIPVVFIGYSFGYHVAYECAYRLQHTCGRFVNHVISISAVLHLSDITEDEIGLPAYQKAIGTHSSNMEEFISEGNYQLNFNVL